MGPDRSKRCSEVEERIEAQKRLGDGQILMNEAETGADSPLDRSWCRARETPDLVVRLHGSNEESMRRRGLAILAGTLLFLVVRTGATAQGLDVAQVIADFGFPADATERIRRGEVRSPIRLNRRTVNWRWALFVKQPPAAIANPSARRWTGVTSTPRSRCAVQVSSRTSRVSCSSPTEQPRRSAISEPARETP